MIRLLLLTILMPLFSTGQITIKGRVIDKTTAVAIPYVTIGLSKENKGTSAMRKVTSV